MFGLKESVAYCSISFQTGTRLSFFVSQGLLARKSPPVFESSAPTILCFAWLKNRLRYDMDESGELELEEFLRMARRRKGGQKSWMCVNNDRASVEKIAFCL